MLEDERDVRIFEREGGLSVKIHRDLKEAARYVFEDEMLEKIFENLHLQNLSNRVLDSMRKMLANLPTILRMIRTYEGKEERMKGEYGREIDFSDKIEALKDVVRDTYWNLFLMSRPDLSRRVIRGDLSGEGIPRWVRELMKGGERNGYGR